MNKILVSGLAIGSDSKLDTCQACNYDLSWLFNNPSTLLWADKIILTPEIMEHIKKSSYPDGNKDLGRAINLIFEGLDKNGIIEVKKPSDVITEDIKKELFLQIEKDTKELSMQFPKDISIGKEQQIPGQMFVSDAEFCTPSLWTKYASLILAKEWDASLFFPQHSQMYFDKLFLLNSKQNIISNENAKRNAFEEIFKSKIPEYELLPIILFDAKLCESCGNVNKCTTDVFSKVDDNINNALEWRTYDEIYQLKEVLKKISNESKNLDINSSDIIYVYKDEELKIRKKLHSVFPKVERWSNMTTVLSIPVIVAGVQTGSVALSTIGASTAGIATTMNKYLDVLKNKYRWVGHKITK